MYSIDFNAKGVLIRYTGAVCTKEMSLAAAKVQRANEFANCQYAIHDLTASDSLAVERVELPIAAKRANVAVRRAHKVFVAAFVGSVPELTEMVNHIKRIDAYEGELQQFNNLADACDFIEQFTGSRPPIG